MNSYGIVSNRRNKKPSSDFIEIAEPNLTFRRVLNLLTFYIFCISVAPAFKPGIIELKNQGLQPNLFIGIVQQSHAVPFPVGADLCVCPLPDMLSWGRANTQVRPYKSTRTDEIARFLF